MNGGVSSPSDVVEIKIEIGFILTPRKTLKDLA